MAERQFFEFGPFRLDPKGRMLFRGERPIPLPPKAADTLLLLVQNAEAVVEKEHLLAQVWPDTSVEEGSLTRTIFVLRKALEDGEGGQEYITTIPKRGYRLSVPVSFVEGAAAGGGPSNAPKDRSSYIAGRRALAFAIGVVVLLSSYFIVGRYFRRTRPDAGIRMIAVLPFRNLTGDPAQEFIADGLTEEMITQLGGLKRDQLGVIARTSAMTYKGSTKPVSQIGRKLGVNYVLEGSVRRWGKRIRISTQLIQTRDQTHVWAHNYESDAEDVLKLQSQVSQAVAQEINLTDGRFPQGGVVRDKKNGSLYGTTLQGGSGAQGTVFRVVP